MLRDPPDIVSEAGQVPLEFDARSFRVRSTATEACSFACGDVVIATVGTRTGLENYLRRSAGEDRNFALFSRFGTTVSGKRTTSLFYQEHSVDRVSQEDGIEFTDNDSSRRTEPGRNCRSLNSRQPEEGFRFAQFPKHGTERIERLNASECRVNPRQADLGTGSVDVGQFFLRSFVRDQAMNTTLSRI